MFHTVHEAEIKLPAALAPDGLQSWKWMEFAIQAPYFLVSAKIRVGESTVTSQYLFGDLTDAIEIARSSKDMITSITISLMSPGYLNKTGDYQLKRIREIWECKENRSHMYLLSDGSTLHYPEPSGALDKLEMTLILRLE